MSVISELTKIAKAEVGNNGKKYRMWFYARTSDYYGVNWCAVFISWLFNQAGELNKLVPKTDGAGCFAREYDGKNGKWYESEYSCSTTTPKAGDIVTFTWNGVGKVPGQDKYYSNHVGYVYAVDSNNIYTIEGNTGSNNADYSEVAYRQYNRKSGKINGYYRPNYSDIKKESEEEKMNNFQKGDRGDAVLAYKTLLIQAKGLGLIKQGVAEDNIFGDGTEKATKEIQKLYKLEIDGIAGVKTITALRNAINNKIEVAMKGHNAIIDDLSEKLKDMKV